MSANGNFLQNMAPNAKRSFFVTLAFAAVGAMLFLFAVEPTASSLAKERRRMRELQDRQARMNMDLKSADTVKKRLADVEGSMKPFEDAMLSPRLGSYAVQAQKLVDEDEITRRAQAYAMEMRERAEQDADSIYSQACMHVDKMLSGAAAALSRSAQDLGGLRDSLLTQGQDMNPPQM